MAFRLGREIRNDAEQPHHHYRHHGFLPREGCLQTPELRRPPLDQIRGCSCKLCWTQHAFLQQRSDSPNGMKPPASELKSEHPCSHPSSFRLGLGCRHGADSAEGSRCGVHTSYLPAEMPSQSSAADCLITPHHHSEHTYVPRTPQTDDFAQGTGLPHEPASAAKLFSPSIFNQSRNCDQKNLRVASTCKGSAGDCRALSNQITLYRWYLIRGSGGHSAEVAVGGFFTLGAVGTERLETAAIVKRIEKCMLLAKDGVEVRLMGLIDDCTTVSNGFSLEIVHSFLSGFPYTWNHLLDNEFRAYNTRDPPHQVSGSCGLSGGVEMSQLSFEGCSNQEKNVPPPSDNEVPVSCDLAENVNVLEPDVKKILVAEAQTLVTEGRTEKEATETKKSVPPPSGNEMPVSCDLAENANVLEPDVKKILVAEAQTLVTEAQTEKEATAVSPRITRSMHRMRRHLFDGSVLKDREGEHSPAEVGGQCKSFVNTTPDTLFKKRVEGVHFTRSRRKSAKNDNRDGKFLGMSPCYYTEGNEIPVETGQGGSEKIGWITASEENVGADECLDVNSHQYKSEVERIEIDRRSEKAASLPLSTEIEKQERLKNRKTNPSSKGEGQAIDHLTRDDDLQEEVVCAAEVSEVNTREAEENLIAIAPGLEEVVPLKDVEISTNAKQEDRLKKREIDSVVRNTGQCTKYLAKASAKHRLKAKSSPMSHGEVKEKARCKAAGSRLTEGEIVDSPRYQSGSKRENVATEAKELHVSCKTSMLPPPLPCPRVPISKRLISAAFGLKTSRSGRLLVPPLAHWRSQSLLRDKDGGIIAISDGSKDMSNVDTGYFQFKPPVEAGLKKLQKRLREAAAECNLKKKPASIKRMEYS